MKLIIDIPYEAYYTFKCDLGKGNLNALGEIVANGTPYEERPQGEWLKNGVGCFKCSICGRGIATSISENNPSKDFPFCHCGAEMKKGGKRNG